MAYSYERVRETLFTDKGQQMFLKIRDNVQRLTSLAGAVRLGEATQVANGDSWTMIACLDRMVELEELVEVSNPVCSPHDRVFVRK